MTKRFKKYLSLTIIAAVSGASMMVAGAAEETKAGENLSYYVYTVGCNTKLDEIIGNIKDFIKPPSSGEDNKPEIPETPETPDVPAYLQAAGTPKNAPPVRDGPGRGVCFMRFNRTRTGAITEANRGGTVREPRHSGRRHVRSKPR